MGYPQMKMITPMFTNLLIFIQKEATVDFTWSQLFTNNLEFVGFVTGIFSVLLLIPVAYPRLQYLAWPIGIVNSVAYLFIFYNWALYGSTALQPYFIVATVAGTWVWRGQFFRRLKVTRNLPTWLQYIVGTRELPTTHTPRTTFAFTFMLATAMVVPAWLALTVLNDAAAWWDGAIFCYSAAAIWLQIQKYVQSWYLWILVDLIAIPVYYHNSNGGTFLLYIIFMIMCFFGLYTWHREADRNRERQHVRQTLVSPTGAPL